MNIVVCVMVRPLRFVLLYYLKKVLVLDHFIELIKYTHHEMRLNKTKKAETLLRTYATINIIENWRYYEQWCCLFMPHKYTSYSVLADTQHKHENGKVLFSVLTPLLKFITSFRVKTFDERYDCSLFYIYNKIQKKKTNYNDFHNLMIALQTINVT